MPMCDIRLPECLIYFVVYLQALCFVFSHTEFYGAWYCKSFVPLLPRFLANLKQGKQRHGNKLKPARSSAVNKVERCSRAKVSTNNETCQNFAPHYLFCLKEGRVISCILGIYKWWVISPSFLSGPS